MKKSLKDLYKEHRSQILTGIISSLLTAIIIGIYHWILVTAPTASAGIWGKIVNLYYTTAAQEQENSASVMLLSILVGILFGIIVFPLSDALKNHQDIKDLQKAVGLLENENTSKTATSKTEELFKKKPLKDEVEDLRKMNKKFVISGIAFLLLGLIIVSSLYAFAIAPSTLYNRFRRDIIQIRPYVEETNVIMLKSKWVSMRSKEDYLEIYSSINAIKTEYQLP